MEIAVVRLGGGGDAAVGDYGQLQSPTGVGVELADQVADNVAVVGRGPNPGGDRELTRAHVQGRVVLCLQERAVAAENGGTGFAARAAPTQLHAAIARHQAADLLLAIVRERPVGDQALARSCVRHRLFVDRLQQRVDVAVSVGEADLAAVLTDQPGNMVGHDHVLVAHFLEGAQGLEHVHVPFVG